MRPKITVIGSINMDVAVRSSRIPNIGETILGESVQYFPGGKGANQAVACSRLGADVSMIGALGDDDYGNALRESLSKDNIDTSGIKNIKEESSGLALILLEKDKNRIIVIQGANAHVTKADIDLHKDKIMNSDIVLLQMEIPLDTIIYAASLAKKFDKTVILNPAPARKLPHDLLQNIDILTPNETELQILASEENHVHDRMVSLLQNGVKHMITTIGEEGVLYKEAHQELISFPGYNVQVVDTTGAGDCFNGGLASALGRGMSIKEAISFANRAAALSVCRMGGQPSMPILAEVEQFILNE